MEFNVLLYIYGGFRLPETVNALFFSIFGLTSLDKLRIIYEGTGIQAHQLQKLKP